MATIIKATDPRTNVTDRVLKPLRTVLTAEVEEPATLEMFFENDWDLIYDETNENNPLALGSKVVVTRDGTTIFKGFVHRRDLVEGNGEKFIHVLCLDKLAKVRDTVVHDSGEYTFARTTPATSFSQVALEYRGDIQPEDLIYEYYPTPTNTSCYLPTLSYLITGVNTGTKTFTVDGDATNECYAGIIIEIYGSSGNDGFYTVVSSSYTSPGATTDIVVSETIPSATVDGNLQSEFRTNWDTLAVAIGTTYSITGINQSPSDYFTIAGDHVTEFNSATVVQVDGSTGNDGIYQVSNVVLNGGNTEIYVETDIPSATVDGTIEIDTLKLGTSYKALLPDGLLLIDDEVVAYTGYISNTDGYWYVGNIVRGALGTTPASHSASTEVRQLVPLKIHPAEPIIVEGYTTESPQEWVELAPSQYFVQPEEGRIELTQLLENLFVYADRAETDPRRGYDSLRISYSAFNELSSSAIRLDSIAELALGAAKVNGGAGLASNEYNIDLPSIRLTRAIVSEPINTLDLLDTIEAELNFQGSGDLDVISTFYDSQSDLVCYKTIAQKTTADRIYTTVYDIQRDFSLDEIYSGIIVKYKNVRPLNLAHELRVWTPEIGDTLGSNAVAVNAEMQQLTEEASGFGWIRTTSYPVGFTDLKKAQAYTYLAMDGLNYTGWGLGFSSNPGTDVYPIYCWFNEDADSYTIDRIKIVLDVRRESDSTNPINIKVVGYTDYVPPVYDGSGNETTPHSFGSEIDLNGALQVRFNAGDDTDSISEYVIEASDIGVDCNAIAVKFDGVPRTRDGYFRCMFKEIEVNGFQNKAIFVKLETAQNFVFTNLAMTDYLADSSYEKLIDDEFGNYKIKIIDVGTANRLSAASLGRLALLESLALAQQRVYKVKPDEGIPVLGETVQMADSFEGVVISTEYVMEDGLEELNLRIIDLESELV